MLKYNEIVQKSYIVMVGEPYEVISSHVFRKQANKPVNQTKLKSLVSGKVVEKSFHSSEKVEKADIETKNITYLYNNRGEYWFSEENDPSKRFSLPENIVGKEITFVKEKTPVEALVFNDNDEEKIIGIKVPLKVELEVTEAPPGIKGNTAQGGTKQVVLETGTTVNTPLFINEGDIVRVNTETGQYAERVDKK